MSAAPDLRRPVDALRHWAAVRPESRAAVLDQRVMSYSELDAAVDRCAAALLAHGVRRGERVALLGHPGLRFYVVVLACLRVGAIWVGLNPKHEPDELRHVVQDSRPALVLIGIGDDDPLLGPAKLASLGAATHVAEDDDRAWEAFLAAGAGHAGAVAGAEDVVTEDDVAAIVYTSGSTGAPKGAMLPQGGLAYCAVTQRSVWPVEPLRVLCDLPINHVGCLGDICLFVLVGGGTVVFCPRFDPERAVRLLDDEQITLWGAVPTMLLMATRTPAWVLAELAELRQIVWSGATAPAELVDALLATGAAVATCYGSTETVGSVTFTDAGADREVLTATVGRPHPRYEVRLAGPDGQTVPLGSDGEVLVRGRQVIRGYWEDPEATAQAIDADGWLHTGDIARLRPDGNLELVGRLKEMFISGGYNVYPREVELALEEHPGVAMAAVIGVPDETFGEVGRAFVLGDADPGELMAFARERLANYKRPKAITVAAELPMLPIGKIDKRALREEVRRA